jgi:hypothetical protein
LKQIPPPSKYSHATPHYDTPVPYMCPSVNPD